MVPLGLRIGDARHAQGFDVQCDIEVLRGHRVQVLGKAFTGVGIEFAAMMLPIFANWSALRPGLPRNIMCSWAWAVPGNPAGVSCDPTM